MPSWISCGSGSGNLNNSGTPLIHQMPVWVDGTHIKGIANGTSGQVWGANTGADPGQLGFVAPLPSTPTWNNGGNTTDDWSVSPFTIIT